MEPKIVNKRQKVKMTDISHLLERGTQKAIATDFKTSLSYVNAVVSGRRFNVSIYERALTEAKNYQERCAKADVLNQAAQDIIAQKQHSFSS